MDSLRIRTVVNSKNNWNYSIPFNSIPELELKDVEQNELELKDFEQKELELNEKELIFIFWIWPNPTFQSVHKQQTCLIS